jgi:hypothetical protein
MRRHTAASCSLRSEPHEWAERGGILGSGFVSALHEQRHAELHAGRLGYSKEEVSVSGFRATASTLKLMAALRAQNLLTEEEWAQIKNFLDRVEGPETT